MKRMSPFPFSIFILIGNGLKSVSSIVSLTRFSAFRVSENELKVKVGLANRAFALPRGLFTKVIGSSTSAPSALTATSLAGLVP